MKSFINDPQNFEKMIKVILSADKPDQFNKDFLVACGFSESNSILYSNLFISLGLIDEKGVPAPEYDRFLKSDEDSRSVIAEKIWEKYTPVFAEDRHIQDKPIGKISEVFRKVYGSEHSESFVHLLALTFKALIDYAGLQTTKRIIEPQLAAAETYTNGVHENIFDDEELSSHTKDESESEGAIPAGMTSGAEESIEEETRADIEDDSELPPSDILDELFNDSAKPETKKQMNTVESETIKIENKEGNEFLSKALFKRANLLQKLDRTEEEVEALNQIVEYFDNSGKSSGNDEVLSKTLIRKAEILEQIGDDEKALAAYEDYIQRFYKGQN